MKKFIITEEEKNRIRGLYEQTSPISITGEQPVSNTDWDLVHGILGSKRIDDDLEKRVGDALQKGNYRVKDVKIDSYKQGDKIITTGNVILSNVEPGEKPHKYFTTRGSIGGSYEQRHDTQVSGLSDRLKNYYKGEVTTFGPFIVKVKGTNVVYKQSFFAIEGAQSGVGNPQQSSSQQTNGQYWIDKEFPAQTNPATLRQMLIDYSIKNEISAEPQVYTNSKGGAPIELGYYTGNGSKYAVSYIYSPITDEKGNSEIQKVLETVKAKNKIYSRFTLKMPPSPKAPYGYAGLIITMEK